MIKVTICNFGNYPISESDIQKTVEKTFLDNGVNMPTETSVAVVSKEEMQEYVDKYYGNDGEDHPVLSFPVSEIEGEFVMPPDEVNHIGEIVISFPWAEEEAQKTGKTSMEVVLHLAEHGALHLLGIHHD